MDKLTNVPAQCNDDEQFTDPPAYEDDERLPDPPTFEEDERLTDRNANKQTAAERRAIREEDRRVDRAERYLASMQEKYAWALVATIDPCSQDLYGELSEHLYEAVIQRLEALEMDVCLLSEDLKDLPA